MTGTQYDWCPDRKRKLEHRQTYTQKECHAKSKTEIGVMPLQTKDHQRLPAKLQELGERHETEPPSQPAEGANAAHILALKFSLQNSMRQH